MTQKRWKTKSKVPESYQIDWTKSGRQVEEFDKDGSDLNIYIARDYNICLYMNNLL